MNQSELKPIEKRFLELGVDETEMRKEMSFALQAINKSSQLAKCSTESKQAAVLNIALTGLTLNPIMNLAYLVPRYTNKEYVCTLQPSYQGLVKVLTDSGSVTNIEAHVIYENDEFSYSLGTQVEVKHSPALGNRGEIRGVYAIAHLKDGSIQVETMDIEELNKVMEMSESYKAMKAGRITSCVWVDHKPEMCRKTVIRRIAKYLPKTDQWEKAARVIDLDQQDFIIDPFGWKAERIEQICSMYSGHERYDRIIKNIPNMTESEADKLLAELERDAPNEVTHGGNVYHQGKVSQHVKNVAQNVD